MAVSRPQSCKPGCVGDAARAALHSMPASDGARGAATVAAARLWLPLENLIGSKLAAAVDLLAGDWRGPAGMSQGGAV